MSIVETSARTSGARMTIGGAAVAGLGPELDVVDPATRQVLSTIRTASVGQADLAVNSAHAAFAQGDWFRSTLQERSNALSRLADCLEARRQELVDTLVAELGTPVALAESLQVDAALTHLRGYAALAGRARDKDLGLSPSGQSRSIVQQVPIGVVTAIPAYNYPLLISISKVGASLAAGCTAVLVAPPSNPLAVLMLGAAAREADLPPGVINVIVGVDASIPVACATHRHTACVSFTGSVAVGQQVMREAADGLKHVVLELGGKSADVILPDYPLTVETVRDIHHRYLRNAGQGCAAPTRLLVHADRLNDFERLSRQVFDLVPVGDPRDRSTLVGPLISASHRDRVSGFVERAIAAGGRVLARGASGPATGYYYAPHLIGEVGADSEIAQEEVFGPVGVVLPYTDVADAIRIANDTRYGLASYVHGVDEGVIAEVASQMRAGEVHVNGAGDLRIDVPFGGVGVSGIGREWGEYGVQEFLEYRHLQSPAN